MQQRAPAAHVSQIHALARRAPGSTSPATTSAGRRTGTPPRLPANQLAVRPASGLRPVSAKTVGSFVPRLTRPAFERYGFSAAALITDWATIVGNEVASYATPERLKWPKRVDWSGDEVSGAERGRPGATLVLAVSAGRALDVEYRATQMIERINAYFGYRAVAGIRITQVPPPKLPTAIPPVTNAASPHVSPTSPRDELARVAQPSLRAALERMAEGLVARKSRGVATA